MTRRRLPMLDVVVATLAVIGGFWVGVRIVSAAGGVHETGGYVMQLCSAVGAGAVLAAVLPRISLIAVGVAGALAVGIMAVLFVALPHATLWWPPATASCPSTAAVVLALASAACVLAAAWIVRRVRWTTESTASIVVLAMVVGSGAMMIAFHALEGAGAPEGANVALYVVPFLSGYVTQRAIATPQPWACAIGFGMFGLLGLIDNLAQTHVRLRSLGSEAAYGLIAFGLFMLIARWGARVAARRLVPAEVEVPEARLNR